jgi:hypothetical protein
MTEPPSTSSSGPAWSTFVGVLLALPVSVVLWAAGIRFVSYNFCNEDCVDRPWVLSSAVSAGIPYALPGFVLMTVVCYLLMRAPGARTPGLFRPAMLAVLSSAAFLGAWWLLVLFTDAVLFRVYVFGFAAPLPLLVPLWVWATLAVARRWRRAPRTRF